MPRVLLIEDEVGIRITVEDRLRAEGYEVETAEDGLRGYERALAGGVDLIVLDLMLPKKPGLEVCKQLRDKGVAGFEELLGACRDLGVRLVVCEMGMRASEFTKAELDPELNLETGGLFSLLAGDGADAQLLFV